MYRLINDRIGEIIHTFREMGDLQEYSWLISELREKDVSVSAEYQRRFRAFWRMRCGEKYGSAFFDRLERYKNGLALDAVALARDLYAFPTRKEHQTLEFSFATKLVHTINPHLPIYDSMVSIFYFFAPASSSNELEKRLLQCGRFYDFLKGEYARILSEGILYPAMRAFRQALPSAAAHTDEKVVDWIIWQFINLAFEKGWFISGLCQYR